MSAATPSYSQNNKCFPRPKSAEISSYHAKLVATAAQNPDQLENVPSYDLPQPHSSAANKSPQPHPSTVNKSPELLEPHPSAANESPKLHHSAENESNNLPNPHPSFENESLKLPDLCPPPAVLPLETPPSPVAMVRMSPKVAASLEKIDQVLAAAGGDKLDSVS